MSKLCDCATKNVYDCGRSDDEHEIDTLKARIEVLECEAIGHSYIEGMVHDAIAAEDVIRTKAQKLIKLLNQNTQPGYPMEADTGECYYCGQGLCEDEYGYQDDELMTPEYHKPECAWRQAREFIEKEIA